MSKEKICLAAWIEIILLLHGIRLVQVSHNGEDLFYALIACLITIGLGFNPWLLAIKEARSRTIILQLLILANSLAKGFGILPVQSVFLTLTTYLFSLIIFSFFIIQENKRPENRE